MTHALSIPARLLRGFAVEFLTGHDAAVAGRILSPDYQLSISGHLFSGRDDSYLPATLAQLEQFPGLCVTCHDVVLGDKAVAMRFTEHGAQGKDGAVSTWGGITLFQIADGRLAHGWAEEDYLARKRQLKSGQVDAIRPPHPAPWDQAVGVPDPETEGVVRAALDDAGLLLRATDEISAEGPCLAELLEPVSVAISYLFTAGRRAAMHAVVSGRYAGGFADIPPHRRGQAVTIPVAAIADVAEGAIFSLQVCADRLGLHRSLL